MPTSTAQLDIRLKRAYEPPAASDGTRVLIDRLWPRGVTKEEALIDHWFRDIAPSTELRQWRSEEHTSELQSLMRISYAVFCLKKQTTNSEQATLIIHPTSRTQR